LVLAAVLSGCAGVSEPSETAAPSTQAKATTDTGGLEGKVLSDEGMPLGGSQVAIVDLNKVAQAGEDGSYAISEITPGKYQVYTQRLGYQSKAQAVEIRANQVTTLNIELAVMPIVEPTHGTVIWRGYMKCSSYLAAAYSEECGEGVGTPVGTFGKNSANKIDYDWDIPERPATLLTETTWEKVSTFAAAMRVIIVKDLKCEPECKWEKKYADASGGSPVRLIVDEAALPSAASAYPLNTTVRHWAGRDSSSTTGSLIVILDQPFEVYKTEFFGAKIPDDKWSALPKA
jgi:hypothetical protein